MEDSIGRSRSRSGPGNSRPYRSHAVPACARCRKRKARCTVDFPNLACLLCRLNGAECERALPSRRAQNITAQPASPTKSQSKRRRTAAVERHSSTEQRLESSARDEPERSNLSAHIVGPVVARDAQVLERCLTDGQTSQHRPTPFKVYSSDPSKPVLYINVPRRRDGLSKNSQITFKHLEIAEKLVEPNIRDLVDLYFENHHPCFPVVDEEEFRSNYRCTDDELSATLKLEVYVSALIYWQQSAVLRRRPRPDLRYGWNLAAVAQNEEFMAPDISTVVSALLDLTGRPIFSITGNALNLGRVIALAHTLGLNRDPSKWQLPEREKKSRCILWWALVIHDRWASLSHGTPPLINRANCDVLVPTIQTLLPAGPVSDARARAAHFFVQLCNLTEIIATLLSMVYDLHPMSNRDRMRDINRLESDLEEWADMLPPWLAVNSSRPLGPTPGAMTLHLAYFTARMSLSRLALQESAQSDERDDTDLQRYLQSRCRRSGRRIVDFVASLTDDDLRGFWLPYNAYGFSSAVTLLLRCALEAGDAAVASDCFNDAKALVKHLRRLKDEHGWDLGDICLGQCETFIQRMRGSNDGAFAAADSGGHHTPGAGGRTEADAGLLDSLPRLDFGAVEPWGQDLNDLFPELWDMFQMDGPS